MFDKKDIEAYRSIVVPSGLKQRIERDCAKPRVIGGSRLARFALPMAACLVLLCTVFAYLPGVNGPALSYNGAMVTEQEMAVGTDLGRSVAMPYADTETVSVILTVLARKGSFVSVSTGTLVLLDGETAFPANEEMEIKGEQEIFWELSRDSIEPFELYLRTGDKTLTYVLSYDESADGYVICQK